MGNANGADAEAPGQPPMVAQIIVIQTIDQAATLTLADQVDDPERLVLDL